MTFSCNDVTYDTAGMRRFDTGRSHEPAVFVTVDHATVFVQTMGREFGVAVHRADAAEVGRLWREYAWPELARVLGLRDVRAVVPAMTKAESPVVEEAGAATTAARPRV